MKTQENQPNFQPPALGSRNLKTILIIDSADRVFISSLAAQLIRRGSPVQIILKDICLWQYVPYLKELFPNIKFKEVKNEKDLLKFLKKHHKIICNDFVLVNQENIIQALNWVAINPDFIVLSAHERTGRRLSIPQHPSGVYNNHYVIHQDPRKFMEGKLVDFAIAYKCFSLFSNFIPKLPDFLQPGFRVLGWSGSLGIIPTESLYVYTVTRRGGRVIASDSITNLALFSRLHPETGLCTTPQEIKKIIYDKNKKHDMAFVLSDGDNLAFMTWMKGTIKSQPFPMTFTVNPEAMELCPTLLSYFFKHASNQHGFISGPSGAGYCFPASYNEEQKKLYQEETEKSLSNTGLNMVNQINISWQGLFSFLKYWFTGTTFPTIPNTVEIGNHDILSTDYFSYSIGSGARRDNIWTAKYQLMFSKDANNLIKAAKTLKNGEYSIVSVEGWRYKMPKLISLVEELKASNPDIQLVTLQQLIEDHKESASPKPQLGRI